jgi:DNA-binding response OmpR family regulator
MKVLVVHDEHHNRSMIAFLLAEWGYTAVPCGSGVAALVALRKPDPPQLVILDWLMPQLSGDDFCRRARVEFAQQPLHIIMLLDKRVTDRDMMLGLKAGEDDYLLKPCNPDELRTCLQMGERAGERQPEALRAIEALTFGRPRSRRSCAGSARACGSETDRGPTGRSLAACSPNSSARESATNALGRRLRGFRGDSP